MKSLYVLVFATLAALGSVGSLAYAKNGADDPVGHISGGNGADDPVGHVSGGNGVDDPVGKVDDRGRRAGEPRNGADDRGTTIGRLVDDNPKTSGALLDYRAKKGNREFKTGLKISLPDDKTGITRANARKALITASISNGGVVYAECQLAFDHFLPGNRAEYKVDVREIVKKGRTLLRQNRGSCDTNLTLSGVQIGVPSVKTGDEIVLEIEKDSVFVEISRGKL